MKVSSLYIGAGVAVLAAVAYVASKGAGNVGAQLGSAAVDMVDGAIAGTVETIGEKVGVPKTNMTKCEQAKAEGRTWDASFDCPASDFIKYLWN
jgi:hypothetical protein